MLQLVLCEEVLHVESGACSRGSLFSGVIYDMALLGYRLEKMLWDFKSLRCVIERTKAVLDILSIKYWEIDIGDGLRWICVAGRHISGCSD